MDKNVCYKIVRETFQNPFDKERFLYFIKNLLNKIDESKAFHARGYVYDNYRNYVKTYERLGTYTDPDGKKIDILIVYLQNETSLERARTRQRNFIARYLKDRDQKDAGLIAFVSPNSDDWRFSLVKMDYKFEEGKSSRIKIKEEFTPARRWSFLVGKNEDSHTAKSRLVPIVENDNLDPTLKDLEEAFNIEKVTKEFFEKYRELFLWTKETLDETIKNDPKIKIDFDNKGVEVVDFTKKLLGQIVFLYFLQKKGWFGVDRDADWGTGPRNFLRQLFEERHGKYDNFFNNVLEPLFYEALAREREDDFFSRFDCKIPFLNGGLFDPINNYDWIHTDILLPNDLFSNSNKTKEGDVGNGILDIFDRYNFTVKEDEPLEKEVAVDPEMLGKVFENLLEVKDRKSKGSYYSPREIVHYMCQQSLISYLENELGDKVPRSDIENLIKYGEMVGENEAHVEKKGSETETYYYKLPESIRNNAKLIDEKLATIKICDPAIGSGAFPVGMMSEIVKARNTLTSYIKEPGRTLYNFKRDCIQKSLYGVDIDPGAVEIAKLRLWLSLVVDEDDIKQIKPLPNLDYKIMQGNSLLEEFEGIKLFDDKLIKPTDFDKESQLHILKQKQTELQKEYFKLHSTNRLTPEMQLLLKEELERISLSLKKLTTIEKGKDEYLGLFDKINESKQKGKLLKKYQKEFFETTQKKKKDEIKKQIEKLEWELIELTLKEKGKVLELKKLEEFKISNIKPFFLWRLNFSEVFQEKDGFDVVIANPPYVRHEGIRSIKPQLAKAYGDFYCGTADIYTYFYKCGVDLLRTGGHLCFISPNKFMRAGYGKNIRTFLTTRVSPKTIIDFGDLPIFDATTYPAILLIEKKPPIGSEKALVATFTEPLQLERLDETLDQIGFFMPISALKEDGWNLESQEVQALMEKLRAVGVPLGEYVKGHFYRGVLTGFNKAFVIDADIQKKLIAEDPKSVELIKPWLRGRDIRKWKTEWAELYVIFTRHGIDIEKYPAIKRYLLQFKKDLEPKKSDNQTRGRKPGPYKWFEIQDNIAYYKDFEYPKITWGNLATEPKFAFDSTSSYVSAPANIIPTNDLYLLAVLNSPLCKWWISLQAATRSGGFLEYKPMYVGGIPVFTATEKQKVPITKLVQTILADPDSPSVYHLETEINHLVYALYNLTPGEIKLIEGMIK